MGEGFREILKARARGPRHLGPLDPELCERAMEFILSGEATPAQTAGFLLVGRAVGDSHAELAAYARAARRFVREIEAPVGGPIVTPPRGASTVNSRRSTSGRRPRWSRQPPGDGC